jgi:tetratricopeptide (TPR) repeat protein
MLRVHTAKPSVSSACYAPLSVAKFLDLDPNSYVNYYKRATAYLSLGRHAQAIEDFDNILRINPSFAQVCGIFL